jgi:hypothetical protein
MGGVKGGGRDIRGESGEIVHARYWNLIWHFQILPTYVWIDIVELNKIIVVFRYIGIMVACELT